ncbi:hypothetical protein COOONC_06392 [Cooperia oncophora]
MLQEWDAGLSSDACNEARGVVPSNAPHKFKAEKSFTRDGSVPDMILETLQDGLSDKTQTENVSQKIFHNTEILYFL